MKVFYHNDLDGKCAGFWVRKYAEDRGKRIECISIDYTHAFPLASIGVDEEVWIVDYSISPALMDDLLAQTSNVIWIDHHKTAIEKYKDYPRKIEGLRIDGISGCELTKVYVAILNSIAMYIEVMADDKKEEAASFIDIMRCYGDYHTGDISTSVRCVPYFTRLIGDRDVWKWEFKNDTANFTLGMCAEDTSPDGAIWDALSNDEFESNTDPRTKLSKIIQQGKTIQKYKTQFSKEYIESWGYKVEFEGHRCYVLNLGKSGSEAFGEKFEEYDIVIPFVYKEGQWTFSLYTCKDNIDVSEIAKKYGGGGHKKAAGFSLEYIPWEIEISVIEKACMQLLEEKKKEV